MAPHAAHDAGAYAPYRAAGLVLATGLLVCSIMRLCKVRKFEGEKFEGIQEKFEGIHILNLLKTWMSVNSYYTTDTIHLMTNSNLYTTLKQAKSEEDVKDIYIKALGLKSYSKGLVDIRTDEIWFEAKDTGKHSSYAMFTQLLHYVQDGLNKGETIPPFLAVIDTEKASLMKTSDVLPFLKKKTVKWGKSASQYPKKALDEVSAHIGTYFISFRMATHDDEFISTVKAAIESGDIIRTQITPDNLKQVFDKWVTMIGREIIDVDEDKYALLFFADIMHDGTISTHVNLPAELLHKNNSPVFSLDGKIYELGNKEGYRQFWAIYHKPPEAQYRNYLLERRDSLIPLDERSFKGAYYTPLAVVDKAYDKLTQTLGRNWQKNYIVWDMCCGVGNLEVKHSNPRKIYMSTLDQADIDVMKATKTCVAAQRFQYDYLNDDITDDGSIDYSLTNKVPAGLRKAIAEGKKILVLINPPYAEAASSVNTNSKTNVAKNGVSLSMMDGYGSATRELFTQFIARVTQEIPTATLAIFSKLKYINAPFFEKFRAVWTVKYLGGFVVHSKAFDGLNGNFPIGFLVWNLGIKKQINQVTAEVINKNANPIGEKSFYNIPNNKMLNVWISRPKLNQLEVIPLTNALTPATKKDFKTWSDHALAYFTVKGNDLQNANSTYVLSSRAYGDSGGIYINPENLWQAAIVFSMRRLIKKTWINDRDQFLQPTEPLTNEFKHDCLIWMLFNGSNLTASADNLEWNNKTWSIVNHFIPFTENEVNAPGRFESDFMVEYLQKKKLSKQAKAVLNAGRTLWQAYFSQTDVYNVREQFKLNRPDVGWYQIRNALKKRNKDSDSIPTDFSTFETAYKNLTEKLQPKVFELGFLKE
ncbi:hypothetical protein [Candidatus Venteria ishoeyi]|uniref:Uncharacterized protein n=1 Tax=Candidatus Venteria ishoeyi TaxID=1899563 RepID=A0A1H6F882_9GAMM|nr:hypothetical protein [Candidatus Venteria ishoeyi]SEH05175.1 Uncharacterised protein [Candidatus Venteria ishoeyi]